MLLKIKKKELISFENEIVELFNSGKIRAPIHLYSNNEDTLINFFRKVKNKDWIFCSWRSHYQCLLKGVSRKLLKK
jgi:pyruvate dehydrogenase E1 component alpha subunit